MTDKYFRTSLKALVTTFAKICSLMPDINTLETYINNSGEERVRVEQMVKLAKKHLYPARSHNLNVIMCENVATNLISYICWYVWSTVVELKTLSIR